MRAKDEAASQKMSMSWGGDVGSLAATSAHDGSVLGGLEDHKLPVALERLDARRHGAEVNSLRVCPSSSAHKRSSERVGSR